MDINGPVKDGLREVEGFNNGARTLVQPRAGVCIYVLININTTSSHKRAFVLVCEYLNSFGSK